VGGRIIEAILSVVKDVSVIFTGMGILILMVKNVLVATNQSV